MTVRSLYSRVFSPLLVSVVIFALSANAPCQTPAPPSAPATSFEVASVRPVDSTDKTVFPNFPAAQFIAENISLTLLIAIAYDMSDDRIVEKPAWLDGTLYTVRAKPEADAALTEKQYQPLLQDLLRRRFHLVVHRETRQVSGYELVVAKGGPKLQPAEPSDAMAYILSNGLECASVSTVTLASLLARPVGRPVVDKTGLPGSYKLKLSYAPRNATDSDLPDVFTAVQDQLGLKLESKKVPADFLVIDHVDKTPTEN